MFKYLGCNFLYYRRKGKEASTMSAYALYPVLKKYIQAGGSLSSRLGDTWKFGNGGGRKKALTFGKKKTYSPNTTNL